MALIVEKFSSAILGCCFFATICCFQVFNLQKNALCVKLIIDLKQIEVRETICYSNFDRA